MKTLKLLAVLLSYPSADLVAALPEIGRRLGEDRLLRRATQDALAGLLAELKREDLMDLQERYVAQFDTGRTTSLHLFEHVHGDSRDRGQAMVDLKALYDRAGFTLAGNELPDFLPAVLEYLSTRPRAEVRNMLDDCVHIVRAVGERLLDGGSPYAPVFSALLDIQGESPLVAGRARPAVEHAFDDEWQEAPVEFGPNAQSHGAQQSRPQFIRFVQKPANH
jgi:nitrate reductase molybdenum cofactor assembly chaperone NarJ/NarW